MQKYEIGQKLFAIHNNEFTPCEVIGVFKQNDKYMYMLSIAKLSEESNIFRKFQELMGRKSRGDDGIWINNHGYIVRREDRVHRKNPFNKKSIKNEGSAKKAH